jgi:hypothetical protein
MSTVTISIEDALRLRRPALINAGTVEPNGTITAEALVRAEADGLDIPVPLLEEICRLAK